MKRFMLIVLLVALVGSMAYAVMLTKSNSAVNKIEKKVVKKRSGCGYF